MLYVRIPLPLLAHRNVHCLQNQTEEAAALKAYGAQSGKSALSPTGSKVYDAYTAITNALGFNSANFA